jgi:TolB protein
VLRKHLILMLILGLFAFSILGCKKSDIEEEPEDDTEEISIGVNYADFKGKMAFYRSGEKDKIAVIDFDNKLTTVIDPKEGSHHYALLSPNGNTIVFLSSDSHIYTMSTDGGAIKQITSTNQFYNAFPVWNSDGTKIYYLTWIISQTIFIDGEVFFNISSGGGNSTKIGEFLDGKVCTGFSVSKDEVYLLLGLRIDKTPPASGIYLYEIQNQSLQQVVSIDDTLMAYSPVFSPDEKKIAYVTHPLNFNGDSASYNFKIMTANVDGSDVQTVITIPITEHYRYDINVIWSPDGNKLAFNKGMKQDRFDHLFIINPDGTGLTQITSGDGHDATPSWVK